MFRLATLLENKSNNSLKVCIQLDEFKTEKDVKLKDWKNSGEIVRGNIYFQDKRKPQQILDDFVRKYPGRKEHAYLYQEGYGFAEYGPEMTIISHAFVEYFSRLHHQKP